MIDYIRNNGDEGDQRATNRNAAPSRARWIFQQLKRRASAFAPRLSRLSKLRPCGETRRSRATSVASRKRQRNPGRDFCATWALSLLGYGYWLIRRAGNGESSAKWEFRLQTNDGATARVHSRGWLGSAPSKQGQGYATEVVRAVVLGAWRTLDNENWLV